MKELMVTMITHTITDDIDRSLLELDPNPYDGIVELVIDNDMHTSPVTFPITKYKITEANYMALVLQYPDFKYHVLETETC